MNVSVRKCVVGMILQINVGNYLVGEFGILNNLSYSIPDDASWDITYYTRRTKRSVPTDGKGSDIVYVLSNQSFPGYLKIGYTRKEIGIRIDNLSKATGVPTPFKLEYMFKCYNGLQLEADIHKHLRDFRVSSYKEFFDITLTQAIEAIKYLGQHHI